ncbi:MAG: hypothetical protein JXX29_10295 [Deltaproteobacteria bacterium]|nr:hypothetical protein [Deltaproteobacteria bacterium]MBN2672056.1 hypothetical protein [Deltaproteobacteria bacterium]
MIQWRFLGLFSLILLIAPTPLLANEHNVIDIVVTECAENEFHNLEHLIEVEFSASFPEVITWIRDHRPVLQVRCKDDRIEIQLKKQDQTLLNRVVLDRTEALARDMPRYVALAAVELMAPGGANPNDIPETQVTIAQRSFRPHPPPYRGRRWSIGTLAQAGGEPFTVTFGAGLHGEVGIQPRVSLAAEFGFTTGTSDASLGNIRQTLWSGALTLLSRFQTQNWSIRPGLGFRLGQVIWKGEPLSAEETISHRAYAPWGGPFIALLSSPRLSQNIELSFHVELGYAIFETGALVNNESEQTVSGLWGGIFLGIGTTSYKK